MNFNSLSIYLFLLFCFNNLKANDSLFFVTTIPKCGSHLIIKCLNLITKKHPMFIGDYFTVDQIMPFVNFPSDKFAWGHVKYANDINNFLKKHNFKKFLIYRDPRDWLVSYVCWYSRPGENMFNNTLTNFAQKLDFLLQSDILKAYEKYIEWMNDNQCCCIKFEDLVGPKGGGSSENQLKVIRQMANHIGYNLSLKKIQDIANKLWGGTHTFREGKIGSWKKHFSPQNITLMKKLGNDLLINLGYEKDFNW